MSRWWVFGILVVVIVLVSACAPASGTSPLLVVVDAPTDRPRTATPIIPTLPPTATAPGMAQITLPPTFTPTHTPSETPIPATITPTFTVTPTATLTPTHTATATITDTPPPFVSSTPLTWQGEALYADITYDEALRAVVSAPILYMPDEHMRRIYERGAAHLQFDFLLSVGDCNSESIHYLEPLTYAAPSDALPDTFSEATVALYSESFRFKGQSVNSGLNSLSVMDPFWANPNTCFSGESPLACDIRVTQPFASIIMFGANDLNVLTVEGYEIAMRNIIEYTLEADVIPILSTFTVREDVGDTRYERAIRFNGVLVRLAGEYDIPLINFWLEAQTLPDRGILSDNAHLKENGFALRNQLTVEMLDYIQAHIIDMENDET